MEQLGGDQGMGMKRPAEEDYNSNVHAKRAKDEEDGGSEQTTLRFLLESKDAGGIIGKGGQNVKRLRSEFNAVVTVPDTNSPERVLTITAAHEDAMTIFSECLPKIGERQAANSNDKEVQMLVQRSLVGSVIGRGGYKIKETREQTGAQIKVFADCLPGSTERIVSIRGTDDIIVACVREVNAQLNETPLKGPVSLYDPARINDWGDYGGGYGPGGGGGGGRGRGGGRRGGGRDGGGRGGSGSRGGGRGGRGGGNFGGGGGGDNMGFGGNFSQDFGGGGGAGAGANMGGDIGGQWNQGPVTAGGEQSTTQVTIPKDLAGSIIGKGGERIRQIRQRSGANIKIDDPLPGSTDRIITIGGNQSQINFAQFLLQQSVRQYSGKNY